MQVELHSPSHVISPRSPPRDFVALHEESFRDSATSNSSTLPPNLLVEDPSRPLFNALDFPPLVHSGPCLTISPHSPVDSPSFADPTLQKYLNIFTDKSPLSPSVLPLDSIRFENITIRRKKHPSSVNAVNLAPAPYTPLSTRLKNADRKPASSSKRVLRALTPPLLDT